MYYGKRSLHPYICTYNLEQGRLETGDCAQLQIGLELVIPTDRDFVRLPRPQLPPLIVPCAITPTPTPTATATPNLITLRNVESGMLLEVSRPDIAYDGAQVQQYPDNATPNQRWFLREAGDGWFWLENGESGRALEVRRQQIFENGARVQQWEYKGTLNQQWRFQQMSDNMVWLVNRESGKTLEVRRTEIRFNEGIVQQWEYSGTPNQRWRIVFQID